MTDFNTILVERRDAVTFVTLNRPQALNALNSGLIHEVSDALNTWDAILRAPWPERS